MGGGVTSFNTRTGAVTLTGADVAATKNAPVAKTTTYTMVAADTVVLANATSASFVVTLPASPSNGSIYAVKKTDSSANTVTVQGSSGNIDGAATFVITAQYQSNDFVWDGSNWWIV